MFFLVFTMILAAAHFYMAHRLYQCLHWVIPGFRPGWFYGVYGVLAVFMILGFVRSLLPMTQNIKNLLGSYSSYYLGILIYLLIFFLLADLLILLFRFLHLVPLSSLSAVRFSAGLAALLATGAVCTYGFVHAREIKTADYEITLEPLAKEQQKKLVLLSDIHLGAVGSEERLADIVAAIHAQDPDVVCIAGDIFDNDYASLKNPQRAEQLLREIQAKDGVYACMGNHDAGETFPQMLHFLERSHVTVLQDSYITLADGLVLVGRLDPSPIGGFSGKLRSDTEELLAAIPENSAVIVMDHNPQDLESYDGLADLVLCGHTHKGQIFPGRLFTRRLFAVDYGYGLLERGTQVVVSSGAGTWGMPMRVGTDCEIVSIVLCGKQ